MHLFKPTTEAVYTTLPAEPMRLVVIEACEVQMKAGETALTAALVPAWRWVYALHHGDDPKARLLLTRGAVLDRLKRKETIYSNAEVLVVDGEDIGLLRQLTPTLASEEAASEWARHLREKAGLLSQ